MSKFQPDRMEKGYQLLPRPLVPANYSAYIQSDFWKAKRAEAIQFYGRHCARCGDNRRLEVHHISYERLGREEMVDLEVLCNSCHHNVHEADVTRRK